MKYKVSIIVPVYNVALYVIDCLNSIRRQSYDNIEVLIIDDCGTDNSMQLIKEYLSEITFPPYKILSHNINKGLSAARNTGLVASSGDYVLFLDSDDEISETCIESLVKPLEAKEYEVVVGSLKILQQSGKQEISHLLSGEIKEPLKAYADGEWYVMAWNKLCKRDFLLRNELFFIEGLLHEDVVWSFQLACYCKSMYLVDTITYLYKIRSTSIITSMSIEKDIQVYLHAFKYITKFILDKNLIYNNYVYQIIEGKKTRILYSMLQDKELQLYKKYYPLFHKSQYLSPWYAYKKKIINFFYLLRDFHYCLPLSCGARWKRCFYFFLYRLCGRKIK